MGETVVGDPNFTKKQNTPISTIEEGGYFLKTGGVKLLLRTFFGGTHGFGMFFIANAVRTITGPVATSARNRKSQQHKNDHQFFH